MRAVVFGAGGFIGRKTVKLLAKNGFDLSLFDMQFTEEQIDMYRCVKGDFSNPGDVEAVFQDRIDTAVHLISTTVPVTADKYPVADVRGNLINTLEMLDLFVKKNVRRVIFVSSGGTVYGPLDREAREQDACCPICSYGIVKRSIEGYLALYKRIEGLDYTILRVSNTYGAGQTGERQQGIIGKFLHRIAGGEQVELCGDGSIVRDFIHVDDVAGAIAAVMEYEGPQHVFNVGTGIGHSVRQVLEMIESIIDKPVTVLHRPGNSLDILSNVLDISKIRSEIGWRPEIDLEAGITKTYHEIRSSLVG